MNIITKITAGSALAERKLWHHRTLILTLTAATLLLRLWFERANTVLDSTYATREMLINYADGFVRRGLSGDILLRLSDIFGGLPTHWALAAIGLLTIALFVVIIRIYAYLPDDPALVPLVFAPWGVLFFLYHTEVMIRKEIFGYLALAIILLGTFALQQRRAVICLAIGCLMMPIAILLHEVNAALAGCLLIAAWMLLRAHPDARRAIYGWVAFAIVTSALSFFAVATHATVDPRVMCDAVGFVECKNPFRYLSDATTDGITLVKENLSTPALIWFAAVCLLCSVPFWGLRLPRPNRAVWAIFAAGVIVPVLPLFVVAFDYGRLLGLIFFPASLLAVTALAHGWITYRRILPPTFSVLYCATWSFCHVLATPALWAILLWPLLGGAVILHRRFAAATTARQ